jgi:hypothetical protein
MKYIFLLAFILNSTSAMASDGLKVGDILLQPLDCFVCSLIETEEDTIYSHMGVVLQVRPEIIIGEAWGGKVRGTSLAEFKAKTQKGQRIKVIRFQNDKIISEIEKNAIKFYGIFSEEFNGKKYDEEFLWHNFDAQGFEKFYCSEFISKLFQGFLRIEMPIKRMHFNKYPEQWNNYFKGKVPRDQWGNSPADFDRSELFHDLGEL